MKKLFLNLIGCAVACLIAFPAAAEINGGDFSISPFVGALVYDSSQDLSSSFATGLRLGYHPTANLGLEGQFTYGAPRYKGKTGNIYNARADILYHLFPDKKLIPFFAVGGGWMNANVGAVHSSHGVADAGVGLKYFIEDSIALRADFRQVMSISPKGSGTWQNSEITFGLTVQFGKAEPSPQPVVETVEVDTAKPLLPPEPEPEMFSDESPSCWRADGAETPSGKTRITGICIGNDTVEIQSDQRIRKYEIFTLAQPSRLVVEIDNGASGFKEERIRVNRLGINEVRFQQYPEFLRVFLNAGQGRILPYRVEESDQLKIIMTPINVPSQDEEQ